MPDEVSVSANVPKDTREEFDEAWKAVWDHYFPEQRYSRSKALEKTMELMPRVLLGWEESEAVRPTNTTEMRTLTGFAIKNYVEYQEALEGRGDR